MNKKGEGEILVFVVLMAVIFIPISIYNSGDYNNFMNDCESNYKDDFQYNSTCYNLFNETEYSCGKTNKVELEIFCSDKFIQIEEKLENTNILNNNVCYSEKCYWDVEENLISGCMMSKVDCKEFEYKFGLKQDALQEVDGKC